MRYTVPSSIHPHRMQDKQIVRFRVGNASKNSELCVYFDDSCIMRLKKSYGTGRDGTGNFTKEKNCENMKICPKITIRIEQGKHNGTKRTVVSAVRWAVI